MTWIRRVGLGLALLFLLGLPSPATASPGEAIGASEQGAPINAYLLGDPNAPTRIVVLGQMHGDEPAGRRVVKALRTLAPPDDSAIWVIPTMNPDGHTRGTRTNARGVDLNRNFPTQWREGGTGTRQWSGPRAASESETQAMMKFLRDVRPTAVLSFHQPFGVVDITHPPARKAGRLLARWMDMPARAVDCSGPCPGTLTEWATQELDTVAITIELPGIVRQAEVDRAAKAVTRLAGELRYGTLSGASLAGPSTPAQARAYREFELNG